MRKLILVLGVSLFFAACGQPPKAADQDAKPPAAATPETTATAPAAPGSPQEAEAGRQLAATKGAAEAGTEPGSQAAAGRVAADSGSGRASSAPSESTRTAGESPEREWREVTIPAGTVLPLRLSQSIGSDTSRVEDPVSATLASSVRAGGRTAIPAGSAVRGTITEAKRSGRVKGRAILHVRFDSLSPRGADERYTIRTGLVTRKARGTTKKDALEIGAPTVGGAVVGGILGGKKGAIIGGTVGGAAGTAVVLSTRGEEVRLPRGSRISVKLLEPLQVRVRNRTER